MSDSQGTPVSEAVCPCPVDSKPDSSVSLCQQAALRTYMEMRMQGETDRAAFDSSVRLYRFRHPEVSHPDAIQTVAGWVDDALGA